MNDVELAVELTDHKHRIGSLEHRMEDSETEIRIIHTIAKTLELLVYKADNTDKNVEKLAQTVECIKLEPADRLKQIKTAIIAAMASGIISALISALVVLANLK